MNRAPLSARATSRTRANALDAPGPALCPGRVLLAVFPWLVPFPPPTLATADADLFGRFRRYDKTIRLPTIVSPTTRGTWRRWPDSLQVNFRGGAFAIYLASNDDPTAWT